MMDDGSRFEVMVTCDQNIRHQQNLTGRNLALIVLGLSIWPIVRKRADTVSAAVDAGTAAGDIFIEMLLPPKPRKGFQPHSFNGRGPTRPARFAAQSL